MIELGPPLDWIIALHITAVGLVVDNAECMMLCICESICESVICVVRYVNVSQYVHVVSLLKCLGHTISGGIVWSLHHDLSGIHVTQWLDISI